MVKKYTLIAIILATQVPLHGMFSALRNVRVPGSRPLVRNLGTSAKDARLTTTRQSPNAGLLLNAPFGTNCRHFSTRTPNFGPRGQQQGGWRNRFNQFNAQYGSAARNAAFLGGGFGLAWLTSNAKTAFADERSLNSFLEQIKDGTFFANQQISLHDLGVFSSSLNRNQRYDVAHTLAENRKIRAGLRDNPELTTALLLSLIKSGQTGFLRETPLADALLHPQEFHHLMAKTEGGHIITSGLLASKQPSEWEKDDYSMQQLKKIDENQIDRLKNKIKNLLKDYPHFKELPGVIELLKTYPELAEPEPTGWFSWWQ